MQHPLTGATCVALPNVGMCPQLSCALTFMYLQQHSRKMTQLYAFAGFDINIPSLSKYSHICPYDDS
ncbi:hypothetical protein ACRRTK_006313 [Alexandromys fortis]